VTRAEKELSKTRSFVFEVGGGKRVVRGKAYYPTFLRLEMTRDELFRTAMKMLKQYEYMLLVDTDPCTDVLCGELREDEDE
jgi:hypothetical protein